MPKAKIVYGNATDVRLIEDEGVKKADAFICAAGSDETNLLSSLIAWTGGVDIIITKIYTASYEFVPMIFSRTSSTASVYLPSAISLFHISFRR